jgi:hypothetical protein
MEFSAQSTFESRSKYNKPTGAENAQRATIDAKCYSRATGSPKPIVVECPTMRLKIERANYRPLGNHRKVFLCHPLRARPAMS